MSLPLSSWCHFTGTWPIYSGKLFSSHKRPDRLWGPPSLLFSRYRGSFHPGSSLRVSGVVSLFPRVDILSVNLLMCEYNSYSKQRKHTILFEIYDLNRYQVCVCVYIYIYIYRFIHKSVRDFRTRLRNNQDRHGRKEHINR